MHVKVSCDSLDQLRWTWEAVSTGQDIKIPRDEVVIAGGSEMVTSPLKISKEAVRRPAVRSRVDSWPAT